MPDIRLLRQHVGRLLAALVMIAAGWQASLAQGDAQLTQYWAVPTYYNPAATGTTDFLRIRGGARLQWLGIKNAPQNFLVLADSPLMLGKKKIGLGVSGMQETLGLFSNLQLNIQASYKMKLLGGELSIGLQGGYYNSKFKGSDVYIPDDDDYHQGSDLAIPTQDLSGSAFDLSAGVWWTHRWVTVGLSGMHLLQPTVSFQAEGTESSSETHRYETELTRALYFTANSNIPIKNTLFELQPSLLVRTDFSSFGAELTMRATYNKFLWFGLGYRYNDAVSAMIGAQFKNFFLGYAYDYPTSAIAKGSGGSHELIAGYQLKLDFSGKNKNKHRSIRIM